MTLHLKFWGTRGSIPRPQSCVQVHDRIRAILNAAEPEDIATPSDVDAFINGGCRGALPTIYGGNTPCVQLREEGGPSLLIDLGSGARDYASHVMRRTGPAAPEPYHVFMSHLHWDHIMGFPFFMPAYIPGNHIRSTAATPGSRRRSAASTRAPSFPVDFSRARRRIEFVASSPGRRYEIAGFRVDAKRQHHAGDSYGYRFERDGKVVVYSTDSEHKLDDPAEDRGLRGVLPRRRPRDLRRAVLAGRRDLGQGGLGPLQQRRRRRAVPDRARPAPVPLPPRAASTTTSGSTGMLRETRRLEEITRRNKRAAAHHRRL